MEFLETFTQLKMDISDVDSIVTSLKFWRHILTTTLVWTDIGDYVRSFHVPYNKQQTNIVTS